MKLKTYVYQIGKDTNLDAMDPTESQQKKRTSNHRTTIESLPDDILHRIFPSLGLFELIRCSVVCKSWNDIISSGYCKLLHADGCSFSNNNNNDD